MKKTLIISFCLGIACMILLPAWAQNNMIRQGKVEIVQDSRVDSLLRKHIFLNRYHQTLEGYRIQIFFDAGNTSRANAYRVKDEFTGTSPDSTVAVYVTFKEPYYRVRVGDFRTRMEAEGFMQLIRDDYPNAFPIKDQINWPKL